MSQQVRFHGNEYFEAVWCNEFILAMQAACEHWKEKQLGVFSNSMLRPVDFEGYEAGENFLIESRDNC